MRMVVKIIFTFTRSHNSDLFGDVLAGLGVFIKVVKGFFYKKEIIFRGKKVFSFMCSLFLVLAFCGVGIHSMDEMFCSCLTVLMNDIALKSHTSIL